MSGFTKLFASITESSIWTEDDRTLRVWVAMLARSDSRGIVEGSIPGFASLCRMSVEDFMNALGNLSSPDPYSRTPDHEGRRIEPVQGGWRILNYLAYRERGQAKDGSRAPYFREYRATRKTQGTVARNKRNSGTVARNTEAEAEAENTPPNPQGGESPSAPADRFDDFWKVYPRKDSKQTARKAWRKVKPAEVDAILRNVAERKTGDPQWTKDGGQYIPHAASFLNHRRWEDGGAEPAGPLFGNKPLSAAERKAENDRILRESL